MRVPAIPASDVESRGEASREEKTQRLSLRLSLPDSRRCEQVSDLVPRRSVLGVVVESADVRPRERAFVVLGRPHEPSNTGSVRCRQARNAAR